VEQQLAAGLGEGEIAEFVEDDEVETGHEVGEPSLSASPSFGLEAVHQVDGVEEATARAGPDAASRDGDRQMRLAGSGAADQDDVALLGNEGPAGEVTDQSLVDRCSSKAKSSTSLASGSLAMVIW
jgi:hypothetical protein